MVANLDSLNRLREGKLPAKFSKFADQTQLLHSGNAFHRFGEQPGLLLARLADADHRSSANGRMLVEDCFTAHRIDLASTRPDAVCQSTAVPESLLFVEVTDVARAVPDGVTITDLGKLVRVGGGR